MSTALLSLAFVAGAVAAFNPCGFALLPAYLSLLVAAPADPAGATGQLTAITRAGRFTAGMTLGFVVVFGLFGVAAAPFAVALQRRLPLVTVVIGGVLLATGAWLLAGRSLTLPLLTRKGRAPGTSWASQIGYGVTFALASLSCTAGPFVAVTAGAIGSGGPVAIVVTYVTYAAGMGAVVGVLALASATASTGAAARMRRTAPYVARVSGALLVLAGTYVAWYGWFELRVLAGTATGDPVVEAATGLQAGVARAVAALGAPGLTIVALMVGAVLGTATLRRRRAGTATLASAGGGAHPRVPDSTSASGPEQSDVRR